MASRSHPQGDFAPLAQDTASTVVPTALRLDLLGGCAIWLGPRPVPEAAFARRKALSLLKLLALQPRYQLHRDQVLDALWPDLSPESAATQFYKAIHHVRQAFASAEPPDPPDALLQMHGDVVSLAARGGVSTDVGDFEELARRALTTRDLDLLQRAVSRYDGDLLPGDLYEPWTAERRDALRERFNDLLVELGEAYLATGALAEAADALRRAVGRDPAREDAHRGLMLVYARQGSRARALRQYHICAQSLERELGVDVSEGTAALHQAILEERVPRAELRSTSSAVSVAILPAMIGRRTELHVIAALLDRLAHGQGAVLGLEADAGIGKTRLAQEILRLGWQRRWHVLFGGAHEQEGQLPYMPFVEALRGALWLDPAVADLIPAELAVAIPEIPGPVAAPIGLPDRLAAQHALFAGVARFLAARARSAPVILVLDDLHAVDVGSLKLFAYLARETAALPLLLVGAWRAHEPEAAPALAHTLGDLERRQILRRLRLAPLSADEHAALLAQTLGGAGVDPRLAAELYRSSEGNALFAAEMARQLAADGRIVQTEDAWHFATDAGPPGPSGLSAGSVIPQSLQALAARRMASLSPAAAQLLQMAAVIGRDVPLPILERAMRAEETGGSVLDLVDEVLAAGLLVEAGLAFRFPHPLLREAIYERLSHLRRAALHAGVARAIEAIHADDPEAMPVEALAFHYRHAGDAGRAVHYLLRAGGRAEAVYDHDGALARYGEALALLSDGSVANRAPLLAEAQERIGDTYRAVGDMGRSLEAYRQALAALADVGMDAGTPPPDQSRRFALSRKIALDAVTTVDMPLAAEHLAHARTLLGPDPLDEARLLVAESLFAWCLHKFDEALARATRALAIAEAAGGRAEISQAYEMLAISHLALGHWQEGLRYELDWHTAGWSPENMIAVDAHLCLYLHAFHGEESLLQTRRFVEEIAQQSATGGNQHCLAVCHFALGNLALRHGLPDEAAASLARALELHERVGSHTGMAYTLAQQVELLTAGGIYAPAPRLVERGIEEASRAALRDHCLRQLYASGIRNSLAAGDGASAAELVEASAAHDTTCPPCAVCRVELSEALAAFHLAAGEPERALAHVNQALQLTGYAQSRPGHARLVAMLGRIRAARGETAEAERCLREAAALFRTVGDRYDLARTFQALAALDDGHERAEQRHQAEAILARYRSASLAPVITG